MNTRKLFIFFWGILIILAGCQGANESGSQSPGESSSEESSPDTVVIVAIGDSITWGAMAFGRRAPSGGYPAILEAKLVADGYDVNVVNEGISGEQSFETDSRFPEVIQEADIVLMQIGTNDIIRPESCPEPNNCRTGEHIASLLDKALAAKVVPLVSTVTPAQNRCARSWANASIDELNEQIYEIAGARNVRVVDNHQAILNHGGGALFADCLHFKDRGYEVIAQQWYHALVEDHIIKKRQK